MPVFIMWAIPAVIVVGGVTTIWCEPFIDERLSTTPAPHIAHGAGVLFGPLARHW
jgi:hypothetical protein